MRGKQTEFRGRTVAVLGGGREGLSSVRWFKRRGADIEVRDRHTPAPEYGAVLRGLKVPMKTGPRYLDGLDRFDLVVRSPGIRLHEPRLATVRRNGKLTSQTKVFFDRCPAKIVGVTGTKGKGTTSALVARMLKASGKRVWLGGNIGRPTLDFLDRVKPEDIAVLELSSFQLQDLRRSPDVAVVTNVTVDHLDHHRSVREYRSAKRSLTKYQRRSDVTILNADSPAARPFAGDPGRVRWFSLRRPADGTVRNGWLVVRGRKLLPAAALQVPGEHNRANVLAAALASLECGARPTAIAKAARTFRGLPYHLEYLGTKRGVRYFNDSYAVNPTAAIPAVRSFRGPLVVLVGGSDRGHDYVGFAKALSQRKTKALVASGPAGRRIAAAVREVARRRGRPAPEIVSVSRKADLLPAARRIAESGDTALFSPAAASFDWFRNYTERGKFFTDAFRKLR